MADALVALVETVKAEAVGARPAGAFYKVSEEEEEAIMNMEVDEQ